MAGCCWRMTVSTNTSNTGWLYNCIIWFYSFYWLMPSSLILPAPNQEVKCLRTKPDKEEERIDARADGYVVQYASARIGGRQIWQLRDH